MKTPKEFEYDLWIDEHGKCMVRVKSTGEVTEVNRDVMRVLRAAEKRVRRELQADQNDDNPLLLETQPDDEIGESWLADTYDFQNEIMTEMDKEAFCRTLAPHQLSVFHECLIAGKTMTSFAKEHGISKQGVHQTILYIRKKQKYFSRTLDFPQKIVRW